MLAFKYLFSEPTGKEIKSDPNEISNARKMWTKK